MTSEVFGKERLAETKPPLEDQSRRLWDFVSGFEMGQIFLTAFELGVFNLLKEPKTAEQVSGELKTHPKATEKLLDVLVSIGTLDQKDDLYSTAPEMAPFLVEGEPYFARFPNHPSTRIKPPLWWSTRMPVSASTATAIPLLPGWPAKPRCCVPVPREYASSTRVRRSPRTRVATRVAN